MSLPTIATNCRNELDTVVGDTGSRCLIWLTKNWLSQPLKAFQDGNLLSYIHKVFVTWEIVKLQIGVGLFAPLTILGQMGNSKCIKRWIFLTKKNSQVCDLLSPWVSTANFYDGKSFLGSFLKKSETVSISQINEYFCTLVGEESY